MNWMWWRDVSARYESWNKCTLSWTNHPLWLERKEKSRMIIAETSTCDCAFKNGNLNLKPFNVWTKETHNMIHPKFWTKNLIPFPVRKYKNGDGINNSRSHHQNNFLFFCIFVILCFQISWLHSTHLREDGQMLNVWNSRWKMETEMKQANHCGCYMMLKWIKLAKNCFTITTFDNVR